MNSKIIEEFCDYLYVEKNYSELTIKEYTNDIKFFLNFLSKYKHINTLSKEELLQVSTDTIIAFLVYRNYERNNCASTRQRKIASIKIFYKWLIISNPQIKADNPVIDIPKIGKVKRKTNYLTLEEGKKIQCAFNSKNSRMDLRNNAILTLFLATGLRIRELSNINIEDIDFKNNTIRILGKGGKERIVYLNEFSKSRLNEYLTERNKFITSGKENALFLSLRHKRINVSGIRAICNNAFKLIGLNEKEYSPHSLRHTVATYIYKQSKNIEVVRRFLGHSSISSTEIYLHIEDQDVKEAFTKNPLSSYGV